MISFQNWEHGKDFSRWRPTNEKNGGSDQTPQERRRGGYMTYNSKAGNNPFVRFCLHPKRDKSESIVNRINYFTLLYIINSFFSLLWLISQKSLNYSVINRLIKVVS